MFRAGRGIRSDFRNRHLLYKRLGKEDIIGDRLNPATIKYDNPSSNWSKFGKPWDVVFDHPGKGIGCLRIADLPEELPEEKGGVDGKTAPHKFVPEHVPEEENYSHCELVTYKAGQKLIKVTLPATVKKEFKTIIADRTLILSFPDEESS